MVSVPSYKNKSPVESSVIIKEKVLPNPTIVRTSSRRARRATLLRFVRLKERADVSRVQLLLCNISDRPLRYKLKSESGAEIAALPSGKGYVAARGSTRLVLTWRRPEHLSSWDRAPQPKLLLITQFVDGHNPEENKITATRFIGQQFRVEFFMHSLTRVSQLEKCEADKPPVEQLMLDAGANTKRASAEYDRKEEMSVTSSHRTASQPHRAYDSVLDEFIDWICDQPRSVLALITIFALIMYLTGVADSNERSRKFYGARNYDM
uniref:Major sperm protein n=1 Tax=Ascaris lumbricoides TaxID=6252 RepID=A0A0M3HU10_ASCLU